MKRKLTLSGTFTTMHRFIFLPTVFILAAPQLSMTGPLDACNNVNCGTSQQLHACPTDPGWYQQGSTCYLITNDGVTPTSQPTDYFKSCSTMKVGGQIIEPTPYLAVLPSNDPDLLDIITHTIENADYYPIMPTGTQYVFVGATTFYNDSQARWLDDTLLQPQHGSSISGWCDGIQPSKDKCIAIRLDGSEYTDTSEYCYTGVSCTGFHTLDYYNDAYMCAFDLVTGPSCPAGFQAGYNGDCYALTHSSEPWNQEFCDLANNPHSPNQLLMLENFKETMHVLALMQRCYTDPPTTGATLGLTSQGYGSRNFHWFDGSAFPSYGSGHYLDFDPHFHNIGENYCAALFTGTGCSNNPTFGFCLHNIICGTGSNCYQSIQKTTRTPHLILSNATWEDIYFNATDAGNCPAPPGVTTTMAPTTVVPTTVAPTTIAATTMEPTTVAPTTIEVTTVAPTTIEVTTVAPTTIAATTVEPTGTTVSTTTITETATVAITTAMETTTTTTKAMATTAITTAATTTAGTVATATTSTTPVTTITTTTTTTTATTLVATTIMTTIRPLTGKTSSKTTTLVTRAATTATTGPLRACYSVNCGTSQQLHACPTDPGWYQQGSTCYLVTNDGVTPTSQPTDYFKSCSTMKVGGQIVEPTPYLAVLPSNDPDLSAIISHTIEFADMYYIMPTGTQYVFVGATTFYNDSLPRWLDDTLLQPQHGSSISGWCDGIQPTQDKCIAIRIDNGDYNDLSRYCYTGVSCTGFHDTDYYNNAYMCAIDLATGPSCPAGFQAGYNGDCYALTHTSEPWNQEFCDLANNPHSPNQLLMLENFKETMHVLALMQRCYTDPPTTGAMLGLTSQGYANGNFHWYDGSAFPSYGSGHYLDFDPYYHNQNNNYCAALFTGTGCSNHPTFGFCLHNIICGTGSNCYQSIQKTTRTPHIKLSNTTWEDIYFNATDEGNCPAPPGVTTTIKTVSTTVKTTVSTTTVATTIAATTTTSVAPTTVEPTTVAAITVEPTTIAPTAVAPTTVAPTTVAPTTEEPTTIAPTTVAPTTVAAITVAPTTVAAITVAPTTVAPTTVEPTTVAPTTMAAITVEPTTVAAITVAPTTVAPTTMAAITVEPTTVAPTTEEPTTIAPTTVAPTTVAAITVAPTTVAPTTVEPTTVAPTTMAAITVEPTTIAPTTVEPTTVAAITVAPTTVASTTVEPTTVAPTTMAAITVAPTTVEPTTMARTTTTNRKSACSNLNCNELPNGDYNDPRDLCTPYFLKCSNGFCYEFSCPQPLYFDKSSDKCLLKNEVADCR